MMQDDSILLKKARKGDIRSFEELIMPFEKKVYNIAYRMMGNAEDAMDIAQEVFIKIYKNLSGFKAQSSLSTWIYRITVNTCMDEIRRQKSKHTASLDAMVESGIPFSAKDKSDLGLPEKSFEKKEQRMVIENAISQLSEEYRVAVILRDIQGFSYEEIAEILQCSLGTVKSRLNRGRKELRERLFKHRELLGIDFV